MVISEETRQKAVDYEVESIHYITEQIGPRESGMPKELEAQEWLKKELDDNGWADSSTIDEFTIARHALVGFTKVIGVILILGSLLQLLFLAGRPAAIAAAPVPPARSVEAAAVAAATQEDGKKSDKKNLGFLRGFLLYRHLEFYSSFKALTSSIMLSFT